MITTEQRHVYARSSQWQHVGRRGSMKIKCPDCGCVGFAGGTWIYAHATHTECDECGQLVTVRGLRAHARKHLRFDISLEEAVAAFLRDEMVQAQHEHPYGYHCGEWATLVAIRRRPLKFARGTFLEVAFDNGQRDEWRIDDENETFKFRLVEVCSVCNGEGFDLDDTSCFPSDCKAGCENGLKPKSR